MHCDKKLSQRVGNANCVRGEPGVPGVSGIAKNENYEGKHKTAREGMGGKWWEAKPVLAMTNVIYGSICTSSVSRSKVYFVKSRSHLCFAMCCCKALPPCQLQHSTEKKEFPSEGKNFGWLVGWLDSHFTISQQVLPQATVACIFTTLAAHVVPLVSPYKLRMRFVPLPRSVHV